jgi:transposase
MSTTKQYSQEFREKAVRLVLVYGKPAAEAAKEVGVPSWKMRDWVYAARRKEKTNQAGIDKDQAQENAELRKRLKALEMENEILKKATAYFAKALP